MMILIMSLLLQSDSDDNNNNDDDNDDDVDVDRPLIYGFDMCLLMLYPKQSNYYLVLIFSRLFEESAVFSRNYDIMMSRPLQVVSLI